MTWTVVIPAKRLGQAKSRLRGAIAGADHAALVVAMTLDTIEAAAACPSVRRVVVICGDDEVAAALAGSPAQTMTDAPDAGLNPALTYAERLLRGGAATHSLPLAALAADLPALRSTELAEALAQATELAGYPEPSRGFVTDVATTGTVLLTAPPQLPLAPCFGPGSAAAHAASGAVALRGNWPGLRRDVDTAADLQQAVELGAGRHTLALAAGRLERRRS